MINVIAPMVAGLLDKVVEDKDEKAKLAHEIATMAEKQAHESLMGQIEINKAEAKHRTVFVAGWRPFVGWTCGAALLYHYLIQPMLIFAFTAYGITIDLPSFDMASLLTVLMGMLGLGGLRTFEKTKGVSK